MHNSGIEKKTSQMKSGNLTAPY